MGVIYYYQDVPTLGRCFLIRVWIRDCVQKLKVFLIYEVTFDFLIMINLSMSVFLAFDIGAVALQKLLALDKRRVLKEECFQNSFEWLF